jgi:hypothetical protein
MSEEQKPANINQEQPREAWFSSWFDTLSHPVQRAKLYRSTVLYG